MNPYLIGGAAVIAFLSGWQVHGWKVGSDAEKALNDAVTAHNIKVVALETELMDRDRENFQLSVRLDNAQENVRTEYRTIEKEVPKYVPQNTADCNCDLNRGFITLFNQAATRKSSDYNVAEIERSIPRNNQDLAGGPDQP